MTGSDDFENENPRVPWCSSCQHLWKNHIKGEVPQFEREYCPACGDRIETYLPRSQKDYCRNGGHYIGDDDECPRCDDWEEQKRLARRADR